MSYSDRYREIEQLENEVKEKQEIQIALINHIDILEDIYNTKQSTEQLKKYVDPFNDTRRYLVSFILIIFLLVTGIALQIQIK